MGFRKRYIVLFISIFILFLGNDLSAQQGLLKKKLDNGLTIILEENHSAPVVAFQMWVNVGGADEKEEESGISHLLEHMLFKGTERREVGQVAGEVEEAGGFINAYTSNDNTVYHIVLSSRYFDVGLDIISDTIQHSTLDRKELEKEIEVVLEEIRMGEDSPGRRLYKDLLSTAFTRHPYGRSVIGTRETVKGITRANLLNFYRRWYIPQNMTLLVVGDFKREKVLEEISKSFRDFKRHEKPYSRRPVEPVQVQLKVTISTMDINEAKLGIAFHIPGLSHPDLYAIDILASILGHGRSARLYKRLKDMERVVHNISAYAMTPKEPGAFIITAGLESNNIDKAVEGVIDVIERIRYEGVSASELERAKLTLESDFIYGRETMEGRARQLGFFEAVAGSFEFEREYLKGISKVTSDAIKDVIDNYFRGENMTIATILPRADETVIDKDRLQGVVETTIERSKELYVAADNEETKRHELENGVTLLVKEDHANPTVAIYITFPGGLRFENEKTNGLGGFIARMLTRGTSKRNAKIYAEEVENMASTVAGFSGRNTVGIFGKFLSRYFNQGVELMADAILNPVFPDKEIEKVRMDILSNIKREEDYLPGYAFKLLHRALYKKHPYGMPVSGTEETVSGFKREDILSYYKRLIVPEEMVISVVGDIDMDEAIERIVELFGGFNRKLQPMARPPIEDKEGGIGRVSVVREAEQVNIAMGFLGTTVKDRDRYPLAVLAEILSAQSGRLFVNLRDKKSLAYALSAFSRVGVEPGIFALYIGTAPEKKEKAINAILQELKNIVNEKVTEDELRKAKSSLIGGYEIGLQKNSAQASEMSNNELFGLGYDETKRYPGKIESVTVDDVLRVARRYIDLNSYAISVVGPEKNEY
jgi:zinc protease